MRQFLLAVILIAMPVGAFSAVQLWMHSANTQQSLGNLGEIPAIAAEVSHLADQGDLAGAALRVTDLETAWDMAQPDLQPKNPVQWGALDGRIDAVLSALRAPAPDAATVRSTLTDLTGALADPAGAAGTGGIAMVAGMAVTDAAGQPLPCEAMLASLRDGLAKPGLPATTQAAAADFQTKATERCNADDDAHADAFSAQGLALISK